MSCKDLKAGSAIEYRNGAEWWPGVVVPWEEVDDPGNAYGTHNGGRREHTVCVRLRLPDGREALRMHCPIGDEDGNVRLAAADAIVYDTATRAR